MSPRNWAATVGLGFIFVIGWLTLSTVLVVHGQVLDEDTYTSALVSTDAYERVYTEVFADPEMAAVKEQLLGRIGLGPSTSTQLRALATNALRWAVPPSSLQSGTEHLISEVLTYVRGDTARLDADVAVDNVIANIDDTAVVEARTALAGVAGRTATSLDDFGIAVERLAAQLAAGSLPDSIPLIGGATFDRDQVVDTILGALGQSVSDAVRQQVVAAVAADDVRDALITATGTLVAEHAAGVADELRAAGAQQGEFDVVGAIAEHARQPVGKVVDSLDTARDAAQWFGPVTGLLGPLLSIASAAGLIWLHRRSPRRLLAVLAATLLLAGVALLVVWTLVARLVTSPFDDATSTGGSSWKLPAGLRSLLGSIQNAVTDDITRTVTWIALVAIVPGAVLGLVALLDRSRTSARTLALVGGSAALLVVGVAVASFATAQGPSERACNGHAELCGRKYNDVVFAATHNSMSSPDVVTVWPEHDGDLREQLDAGVRALLIDTHYWPPVTSPTSLIDARQAIDAAEQLLPPAIANAMYPTLGSLRDGQDGTFLCHIHCAFGGLPFLDGMTSVREFLDQNPDEVVTLIIQDAISTSDTEAVMHAAGLDPYLYQHRSDHTWPTLGEIIDSGQRLVVFAEEAGPPPSWYANAFEEMQETPYLFTSPERMSCLPNRGAADAPLFQMNHWVQRVAPDRADSTVVNQLDFLVDRARQCQLERGLIPNFIAVNFYNIGDVVAAVDELNGVS